jgi:hypothetical protein
VAPFILPLPSYILHLSLPSSLSNPKVIRAYLTIVDFCHDSAIHASLMALAAPEVSSFFLPLPWARKISLVGAQIFIFIDDAKVQKIQMQNNSFPQLFFIKCNFIFVKF